MKKLKIKSIRKIKKETCYDLTVHNYHNFFANNILVHNCNSSIGKVLVKRSLNYFERFLKFCGININEYKYDLIIASRHVIKNQYADKQHCSFYDSDVWGAMGNKYKDCIQDGITLYSEIVGYTSTGAGIQSVNGKVFDYGCKERECELYVFRITYTSPAGNVYEFSMQQVIDYCNKFGLKYCPIYYIGQAKNLYPELDVNNHWHEDFLNNLIRDYLEKDCEHCVNDVPDEGIVLSRRIGSFEGLKLKSNKFLLAETVALDNGEVSSEDIDESKSN